MKTIKLTQNQYAQVDDDLYTPLSMWKWMYHPKGYAYRTDWNSGQKRHIFMHNEVLAVDNGVDHIDGDGLNNTRKNLRLATRSQNGANRGKQKNGEGQYKGTYKNGRLWYAQIWHKGKLYRSGSVPEERQAAWLYDLAAQELFGKFARLNLT